MMASALRVRPIIAFPQKIDFVPPASPQMFLDVIPELPVLFAPSANLSCS
jgi:hypothetical protein